MVPYSHPLIVRWASALLPPNLLYDSQCLIVVNTSILFCLVAVITNCRSSWLGTETWQVMEYFELGSLHGKLETFAFFYPDVLHKSSLPAHSHIHAHAMNFLAIMMDSRAFLKIVAFWPALQAFNRQWVSLVSSVAARGDHLIRYIPQILDMVQIYMVTDFSAQITCVLGSWA